MSRLILISVAIGMLAASAAFGQTSCAPIEQVHQRLADKWGERRMSAGLQNQSRVFEVWVNEETGTWTILLSRANGTSCIMASGTNYRVFEDEDLEPTGLPT